MSLLKNGSSLFQGLTNLALILGLVLVGYQIKQANDIATATLATAAYQQETDRALALMGENPAAILAKGMLEPENLTPEEIVVVLASTGWRISMMERNNVMEEYGIFSDQWHPLLTQNGARIGRTPIAREYLLNNSRDDWWIVKMQEVAQSQNKGSIKDEFIRIYADAARSYGADGNSEYN